MDKQVYVAHVKRDENGNWDKSHCLEEHLQEVGEMAKQFAGNFGSDWAQLAGLWHDLGKYRKRFQDYIRLKSGFESENAHIENGVRAPHSTAGAIHAVKNLPPGIGHVLAYIIAGHHAGLPDWIGGRGSLSFRLTDGQAEFEEAMKEDIPKNILASGCPEIPSFLNSPDVMPLWIRMLFSCLVDADFLDTERYMQADKFAKRERPPTVSEIKTRFAENMKVLQLNASTSPLVKIRDSILQACNDAAELEPGIFSLTVPTGGGKTLSSLAFALKHAEKYKKKRIIYAIPFTSIIEQNADVFRAFVGEDAVLEHHSNLDFDPKLETNKSRLAAENWDASLIVTTNVQLFESLHASRTSRCRKLHNLVNSVIILDEAQQIPRDFHSPITRVMQQLSDYFGVTWLLCTATQPVLEDSKNAFGQLVFKGLGKVREIIHNPSQLAKELKRVDVELPKPDDAVMTWEEVAKLARSHECVLVIVNTRKQAKQLYELLNDDDALHLSANMCAQHRTEVINAIKHRLRERQTGAARPLRVISTQLIEAGVDVDFPVVIRALSGLDSIAQSAGRCNREGKLDGYGKVVVFKPEQASIPGYLRQGADVTSELIASGQLTDPLSPESFYHYFSLMNSKGERDKHAIIPLLTVQPPKEDAPLAIQFRDAAEQFRLIDDKGTPIVVPFKPEGMINSPVDNWLSQLEFDGSQKWVYKKLQRYTVTVPERVAKEMQEKACIEERAGLQVLLGVYYHKTYGVKPADELVNPEDSVF